MYNLFLMAAPMLQELTPVLNKEFIPGLGLGLAIGFFVGCLFGHWYRGTLS